jgi:hypothetical protein
MMEGELSLEQKKVREFYTKGYFSYHKMIYSPMGVFTILCGTILTVI